MGALLTTLAGALVVACSSAAPTPGQANNPTATPIVPLATNAPESATVPPASASSRPPPTPLRTFPPLATLPPPEATGELAVNDVRIVDFKEFRRRSALLIVEVRNSGEGWAQVLPDETLFRAIDGEGVVLASGTFFGAFPTFVPPGELSWMWVDVPKRSSRGEADLAWDNAVEPADAQLAITAASRVVSSRLRVSVRVVNIGSQTERVRLAVVAFDPDGRVAAAGSELSGWELRPGQARNVEIVPRGRVTGGSTIPFQVIAEPSF